jgi:hypothetical protein
MSPSRVAQTLAKGLAADPLFWDVLVLFWDVLVRLRLHLKRRVDRQRAVEIRELPFSEF